MQALETRLRSYREGQGDDKLNENNQEIKLFAFQDFNCIKYGQYQRESSDIVIITIGWYS